MANYVQLELFDLESYTSQLLVADVHTLQMREKPEEIDREQLELDLFPGQVDTDSCEHLKQAA